MIAVISLTLDREELTQRAFPHNLTPRPDLLYIWDNGSRYWHKLKDYNPDTLYISSTNKGISEPLNVMMDAAFKAGAEMVCTMANDILEPHNAWAKRLEAAKETGAGVVSIPLAGANRYPQKEKNGIRYESGDIIGNFGITRQLYESIGGFYEGYGIYGPIDLDYCARARAAGFDTIYISNLYAEHLGVNNPKDYQQKKEASLKKAWPLYNYRLGLYRQGKDLFV
jgi:GT2 family glycosyltransferase